MPHGPDEQPKLTHVSRFTQLRCVGFWHEQEAIRDTELCEQHPTPPNLGISLDCVPLQEKSQRNLAIKAVVFPDQSNEGSVGRDFEGFVPVEGGPAVRPDDMEALKRMMAKKPGRKR